MSAKTPISFFTRILFAVGMVAIGWQAFSFATATQASRASTHSPAPVTAQNTPVDLLLAMSMDAIASAEMATAPGFLVTNPLHVEGALSPGEYVWNEEGVPAGPIRIYVDLSAEAIYVYRGGYEIGRAVVVYGYGDHPTPLGGFSITQKNRDHVSNLYDAPMPYMMRLTNDGIAIHGSNIDPGAASHGCIGVPIEFAELVFEQAELGTRVLIRNGSPYADGYRIQGI